MSENVVLGRQSENNDAVHSLNRPVVSPAVEIVSTETAFFALEQEWNRVLEESTSTNVFLTWEWLSTWWEFFGKGYRP